MLYVSFKTAIYYSPGSIKVNFMSEFNQRYRDLTDTSAKLAAMLQQHLIKRAPYSSLRINPKTVKITGKLSSDLILTCDIIKQTLAFRGQKRYAVKA